MVKMVMVGFYTDICCNKLTQDSLHEAVTRQIFKSGAHEVRPHCITLDSLLYYFTYQVFFN